MKFLKIILLLIIAAPFFGLLLLYTVVPNKITKAAEQNLTDAEFALLAKDLRRVAALEVMPATPGTRDAGELLNPFIATSEAPAQKKAWWAEAEALAAVEDGKWLSEPREMPEGELSLLTELTEFNYWEASSSGSYGAFVSGAGMPSMVDAPTIRYLPLLTLARLRLAEGLKTGQIKPALQEVRHLSKLIYSDETVIGVAVSVALLEQERLAYEAAVEKGLIQEDAWVAVSEEDGEALSRAWRGVVSAMRGGAGSGSYQLLGELGVPIFGLCAGVTDGAMDVALRRGILGDRMPLEPSFAHLDGPVMAALADDACRVPEARKTLGEGFDAEKVLALMVPEDSQERAMLKPYLRTWVYAILLDVAAPVNPYRSTVQ